jgi:hypothetical protein
MVSCPATVVKVPPYCAAWDCANVLRAGFPNLTSICSVVTPSAAAFSIRLGIGTCQRV